MTDNAAKLSCTAAAVLGWAVALAGGPVADAAPEAERAAIVERILEEDQDRERRIFGLTRARLAYPQEVSAAVGAMVVRQPASYDCRTVCEFKGLMLQAEPGLAGLQLSAGYAALTGETGRNTLFLSNVYLGYSVKGALLRTWGGANLEPSCQTLLGVESEFTVIRVNFSLGLFRHVGSGDVDDPWIVAGGIGWGF